MKKKFKLGVTNGCFDLLHNGHLYSLKQAKRLCTYLIVLLNSDNSVRKIKGKNRPIQSENLRKKKLLATKLVNKVVIFEETTPLKKIKLLNPDVLFKGNEYKKKKISGKKYIEKSGGKVVLLKKIKNLSTTQIIRLKKIK